MVCGQSEQTVENIGWVPWQEGSQEAQLGGMAGRGRGSPNTSLSGKHCVYVWP